MSRRQGTSGTGPRTATSISDCIGLASFGNRSIKRRARSTSGDAGCRPTARRIAAKSRRSRRSSNSRRSAKPGEARGRRPGRESRPPRHGIGPGPAGPRPAARAVEPGDSPPDRAATASAPTAGHGAARSSGPAKPAGARARSSARSRLHAAARRECRSIAPATGAPAAIAAGRTARPAPPLAKRRPAEPARRRQRFHAQRPQLARISARTAATSWEISMTPDPVSGVALRIFDRDPGDACFNFATAASVTSGQNVSTRCFRFFIPARSSSPHPSPSSSPGASIRAA